jgi:hypothetical protein
MVQSHRVYGLSIRAINTRLGATVEVLLSLALVVFKISFKSFSAPKYRQTKNAILTLGLLTLVSSDCTDDRILFACDSVGGAFDVTLRLGCIIFCLARDMLLLARLLPRSSPSDITDTLYNGPFR